MIRVAINGFGRIGRMVLRAGIHEPGMEFVAVNDLTDVPTLAHLLKYDSVHGRFNGRVEAGEGKLAVNGKSILVLSESDPKKLPWKKLNIDVVVESTGRFLKREDAALHLKAGAKKVILTAPPKGKGVETFVKGVNDSLLSGTIISNASCTTNSLAPLVYVLDKEFGIETGLMTTVHSYTADQRLVDAPHKDLRRARAAGINIVPTTTGAATAAGEAYPKLKGKLDGMALRVPTADGSFTDFTCILKKKATKEQINAAMKEAASNELAGVMQYSEEPLVSSDIIGNPASVVFDAGLTKVLGRLAKVCGWYDNEWGYSKRVVDMVKEMG